jgi:hypothetical protein
MAAGPGVRIGDAEREAAANSLREHYASGRLTMEEFQERLDAVFAAKTDRDLEKLTEDLPITSSYAPPWPPSGQAAGPGPFGAGWLGGLTQLPGSAPGGQRGPRARTRPFAFTGALVVLLVFLTLAFALPFGVPRIIVIVLAVFTLLRRILRRVIGGGGRRRW